MHIVAPKFMCDYYEFHANHAQFYMNGNTEYHIFPIGLGTAYRNRTAVYRGTLLRTAVRTTVYCNSIKLTVIVNLSAAMGIHSIDMATSHGV